MPQIEVTEMTNGNVDFISLVNRGANRIGFRIKKSDDQQENMMFNLNPMGALSRALKGDTKPAATGPVVVGIATNAEGEALEAVKKSLEDNGYKTDAMETQEDGTTLFRQEEGSLEGASLVRLSENSVLVMKSFSPYNDDVTSDFVSAVKAQGFYNSIYSATDAFRTSMYEMLYQSDSPAEASTAVKKLCSDFEGYVTGLVSDLPVKAFKMDADLSAAVKAVKSEEKPVEEKPADKPEEEKPADAPVETPAEAKVDAPVEPADKPAEEKPADPAAEAQEKVVKMLSDLTEAVQSLATSQKDLSGTVETIGKAQKSLGDRVDEVARKSEDAVKAIKSTVVAAPTAEDQPDASEASKVKKQDEDPRTGAFDTALHARR